MDNDIPEENRINIYDKIMSSLPNEKWKQITCYDNYMISSFGRVRSKKTDKILKPKPHGGYLVVKLYDVKNNKKTRSYRIHRLVAQEFIDNPDPKNRIYVDHIDNDKHNNYQENLQWVTPKQNTNNYHNNHRKEDGKTVLQFKGNELIKRWNCTNEILREHPEYNESTFRKSIRGNKVYKGFRWKYGSTKTPFKKIDGEKFKNIGILDGFDCSNYEISTYGRIKSIVRNTIRTPVTTLEGYKSIVLRNNGKTKLFNVHYLVARLFVPGRTDEKKYINHIDENKGNNKSCNIEWCTLKENTIHSMSRDIEGV